MIQNIIALVIVFGTITYVIITLLYPSKVKKISKCDGCSGCKLKNLKLDNNA